MYSYVLGCAEFDSAVGIVKFGLFKRILRVRIT